MGFSSRILFWSTSLVFYTLVNTMNPWRKLMTKKRLSAVGFVAAVAIAVSGLFVPSASAADEIVV